MIKRYNVGGMYKKIVCIFLLFISNCPVDDVFAAENNTGEHIITVFVHGTSIARRMMNMTFLRPKIYCPQGLSLAKNLPENYHFYKMAQGCAQRNNQLYPFDNFYIFGWRSESFNHKTRMKAAKNLMQSLQKIIIEYHKKNSIIPAVRLIGFSHGGNVVLNTAHYEPLNLIGQMIDIEVWLIATPIQRINHDYVNHTHFKKVYSVYSKKDWLQRIDPQGLANKKVRKTHFWSDRVFDDGSKCIQVKFTVNSQSIGHGLYRQLFKYFPSIQSLIEQAAQGLDAGMIAVDFKV